MHDHPNVGSNGRPALAATPQAALHDRPVVMLLALYALLNLDDLATTWYSMQLSGPADERAILYAFLYTHLPFVVAGAIKFFFAGLAALYVVTLQYRWWRTAALVEMVLLCTFFAVTDLNNVHVIALTPS